MRTLVVTPDQQVRAELEDWLCSAGLTVDSCLSADEAFGQLDRENYTLVFAESRLDGTNPLKFLQRVGKRQAPPLTILLSSFGTIEEAVAAMRAGAFDFLTRPLVAQEFQLALARAIDQQRLRQENFRLKAHLAKENSLEAMIGRDPRMQDLFALAQSAAASRATVLISGESGTGKTLLARAIHGLSDCANGPFVEVSCGALPETLLESELFGHVKGAFTGASDDHIGRFEQADQGTLFLDEIGTASASMQVKLLRLIQDRAFERVGESTTRHAEVRLILATHTDLESAVHDGRFREDLYYRIHVLHLQIPPLRDRPADILPLTRHFLERAALRHDRPMPQITRQAARCLLQHTWPGNVRELENVLERALLLGDGVTLNEPDLGLNPRGSAPHRNGHHGGLHVPSFEPDKRYSLKQLLAEPERRILTAALQACAGHRDRTAEMLGIHRATLYAKLRSLGIKAPRSTEGAPNGTP